MLFLNGGGTNFMVEKRALDTIKGVPEKNLIAIWGNRLEIIRNSLQTRELIIFQQGFGSQIRVNIR